MSGLSPGFASHYKNLIDEPKLGASPPSQIEVFHLHLRELLEKRRQKKHPKNTFWLLPKTTLFGSTPDQD
jgi:hypothetical protein